MKLKLTVLFLIVSFFTKAQSAYYNYYGGGYNNGRTVDFILVQGDTSLITTFNGLDRRDFGIYLGVRYAGLFSGSLFYTPFNSINRVGITKGFLKDGVRGMAGMKIQPNGISYDVYPEFGVMIHPIRLLTKDPYSFDITFTSHLSNQSRLGFGISFPIQYRNNFRL
jgi:hypothetical protein